MFLEDFAERSEKILEHLREELRKIRTGRAQPSLIEGVSVVVDAYGGARMKLMELAALSAPDPNLLLIQPYDPAVIRDIEKAFQTSELGLNPVVDKNTLRIVIPSLNQERRMQLVKQVAQKSEESKVALRNARTEVKKDIEDQKGTAGISEDDIERQVGELQREVEEVIKKIDILGQEKEKELMQI